MATRCWATLTALLLVVAVGVVGQVAGSARQEPSLDLAAAARCTDVAFVGAGGNGAATTTSSGPALQRLFAATRAANPDRSFSAVSVAWPTRKPTALKGRGTMRTRADRAVTAASAARWAGDVKGYAARLQSRLVSQVRSCPGQVLVLAGHAQGALALHRVLAGLPTSAPAVHRQVGSAALISDGYRASSTRVAPLGAPAARSGGVGVLGGRGAPGAVPAAAHLYPVLSVCTAGDVVCDRGRQAMRRGLAAHATYASPGAARLLADVGAQLGRGVARFVLPASPSRVQVLAGITARRALPLRVLPADRAAVTVSTTGVLPPGLSVDSAGVLSGIPTSAGTWTVRWVARNTAARWTPATSGGTTIVVSEPTSLGEASQISAGGQHSCLITSSSGLRCWGNNDRGQLGAGAASGLRTTPVDVAGGASWSQVSAGGSTTCGVRTDRSLWCWGLNHEGQLGDGTRTDRAAPVRITSGADWSEVSVDWFTTCATKVDGRAFCWGQNSAGQVGDGTTATRLTPVAVAGAAGWRTVQTAGWHSCGVRVDGSAACWGRNDFGELGTGTVRPSSRPAALPGSDWRQLSASWGSTCGVRATGAVQCWGRNDQGQVGDASRSHRSNPQTVQVPAARAVSTGDGHTCALDRVARTWCWGSGERGNLGNGRTGRTLSPVLAGGGELTAIDAGWMHTCGRRADGSAQCWGDNSFGQLGDGTTVDSAAPAAPATPAAATGPVSFNVATFNLLGNNHTAPRSADDHYAPAWIRAQWSVQTWRDRGLSIVGTQESDPGQVEALQRAAGGEYAAWPGLQRGRGQTFNSVWWRTSEWEALSRTTLTIPFMSFRREIPVVQLRSRADPSRTVWVMNVHNSPGSKGQALRDRALAIEVAKLKELVRSGSPVLVTGDFNQQTAFCRIASPTGLTSPRGGRATATTCTPPSGRLRIDWIFGPSGVWSQYAETRNQVLARITDHHLISARVTLR